MKQKGESLIHLCLLSPPDTPAVTGQCSVTRQGQRRRCWDEWKCGECGRNTHTHSISLCNVISGEAASCCFDLILTLSRWPGTVCSLSQIFVDSVLNSNPKWIKILEFILNVTDVPWIHRDVFLGQTFPLWNTLIFVFFCWFMFGQINHVFASFPSPPPFLPSSSPPLLSLFVLGVTSPPSPHSQLLKKRLWSWRSEERASLTVGL